MSSCEGIFMGTTTATRANSYEPSKMSSCEGIFKAQPELQELIVTSQVKYHPVRASSRLQELIVTSQVKCHPVRASSRAQPQLQELIVTSQVNWYSPASFCEDIFWQKNFHQFPCYSKYASGLNTLPGLFWSR